jgi:hypothetical protein
VALVDGQVGGTKELPVYGAANDAIPNQAIQVFRIPISNLLDRLRHVFGETNHELDRTGL